MEGTVIRVVEVKLVTDVTEEARGRELGHTLIIITDTGREGGREGGREEGERKSLGVLVMLTQ